MPVVVIIYQEIEILLKAIKKNVKVCMLFDIKMENPDKNGFSLLNADHHLKPTSEGVGWACFCIQVHQPWNVLTSMQVAHCRQ